MRPQTQERPRRSKPPWLKVKLGTETYGHLKSILRARDLVTVCEEARCPNIGECWDTGTATFMIMGDTCTRGCRFCAVKTARKGQPLDPDEPRKIAEAVAEMGLDYVVLTSVDRDDLPDQGAAHFAQCIRAIKEADSRIIVEVLIPDFCNDTQALQTIVEAQPEVIAHNIETIKRLSRQVRDARADYQQSLNVLSQIKSIDPSRYTKSAIMVGLGESESEVLEAMDDLRAVEVDILTLGQYLQPTQKHLSVQEYVHPDQFARLQNLGEAKGFLFLASGPLVRSSYRAGEFFIKNTIRNGVEKA